MKSKRAHSHQAMTGDAPGPHHRPRPSVTRRAHSTPARVRAAALLLCLLLSSSAAAAQAITTVALKEHALLPGPTISLGDVAAIDGPDATALAAADLGPVPWPGTQRLIDPTVVKICLYRDGIDLRRLAITGDGCVVTTQTVTVSGDEILEAARALLIQRLPWPRENVQIEPQQRPEDRQVPAGAGKLVLHAALSGGIGTDGSARVHVTGKAGSASLFRAAVCFKVRVFNNIIVARRDLHQGETFSDDNIVTRRLDVTQLSPGDLYLEAAPLFGKRAARSIRAGMPITRRMVVIPPIVKRGDVVKITFVTDYLRLSALGLAVEPGAPGDTIRVINKDSGREVTGRVTDTGDVSVSF